jgi:hypothetical protein
MPENNTFTSCYITDVSKEYFSNADALLPSSSIIFMIWEIHPGDRRRTRAEELNPRSLLPVGLAPMCPECTESAHEFMQQAADAVQQAGIKPDDQIWLNVFGSLQRVLKQHGGCAMCAEKRTLGSGDSRARAYFPSAAPVDRLTPWNQPGKKAR